jgi:hypothetical protein
VTVAANSTLNLTINQWKHNNKEPRPRNNKTHPREYGVLLPNAEAAVGEAMHKRGKKAMLTAVKLMSVVVGDSSHSLSSKRSNQPSNIRD